MPSLGASGSGHPVADLRKRLQAALHRKDVEEAIEVIEEDELRLCKLRGIAAPKGRRSSTQVSSLIDVPDKYGMTPLMIACQQGLDRIVLGLMLRGANTNFENQYGQTPLIVACAAGNAKVINRLLFGPQELQRARILYKNRFGHDCFHYVEQRSQAKVLPLLNKATATQSHPDDAQFVAEGSGRQTTYQVKLRATVAAIRDKNRRTVNKVKYLVLDAMPSKRSVAVTSFAKREEAAKRIQRFFRRMLLRYRLKSIVHEARRRRIWMRKATIAATNVQKVFRRLLATKQYEVDRERYIMATRIQAFWRGRLAHWSRRFSFGGVLRQLQEADKEKTVSPRPEKSPPRRRERAQIEHAVKCVLQKRLRLLRKRQAKAACQIQIAFRRSRIWRQKQYVIFEQSKPAALEVLKRCRTTLVRKLAYCEVQEQRLAATMINRFLRSYARTCVTSTRHLKRHFAALCIQCSVRSFQARATAAFMKERQALHMKSLNECLRVKPLQPVRKAGMIAPSKYYGYCGKCSCKKFSIPTTCTETRAHICECGHHITGHVLFKYCASGVEELVKVKEMKPIFFSAVGEVTEYDKQSWLLKTRTTRQRSKTLLPIDSLYNKAKHKEQAVRREKQETESLNKEVREKVDKAWKAAEQLEKERIKSAKERRLARQILEQQRLVQRSERNARLAALRKREQLLEEAKQALIKRRHCIEAMRRKLVAVKAEDAELHYRQLRRKLLKPSLQVSKSKESTIEATSMERQPCKSITPPLPAHHPPISVKAKTSSNAEESFEGRELLRHVQLVEAKLVKTIMDQPDDDLAAIFQGRSLPNSRQHIHLAQLA